LQGESTFLILFADKHDDDQQEEKQGKRKMQSGNPILYRAQSCKLRRMAMAILNTNGISL
jgi:hypothetical protein